MTPNGTAICALMSTRRQAIFCRRRHQREGHRSRNIFVSVGIRNSIIRQHDSINPVIFG
jgi:hypothetical protein